MSALQLIEASRASLTAAEDPQRWSPGKKWAITGVASWISFAVAMSSSVVSPAIPNMEAYFSASRITAILSLSLYILGVSFGPLLFAPLSEVYGRRAVLLPTWMLFVIFQIPGALAPNISTHLVARLIQGIAGSPGVTVTGGAVGDVWAPEDMGPPVGLYALSGFLGPVVGPIAGGYLTQYAPGGELESWRWIQWFLCILGGILWVVLFFTPETYPPTIAARKARKEQLRTTSDLSLENMEEQSPVEKNVEVSELGLQHLKVSLFRPFLLLAKDPIVLLMSLHLSMIYGILYIYFGGYPIVFSGRYGWKQGPSGLAFLGIGVGVLLSIPSSGIGNKFYLRERAKQENPDALYPEGRLPFSIIAGFVAPISAIWFAWTGVADIHWIAPVLSGVPFGWSMVTLFIGLMGFLAETYREVLASCIASTTILRSLFAFAFPLFTPKLYENLTPEWAGTLLAFLLLLFAPVPFLFYKHGPYLRSKSKFANQN